MFRFSLQKILELRAAQEQKSAAALGAAQERAQTARRDREELAAVLAMMQSELHREAGAARSVGELQHHSATVARLQARVARAAEQVSAAEADVSQSDEAYRAAVRDRHVLDRLKARYGELWRAAAARGELSEMDAAALSRFAAEQTGGGRHA